MEPVNVIIKPKPFLFVISKRSDSEVRNRFNVENGTDGEISTLKGFLTLSGFGMTKLNGF